MCDYGGGGRAPVRAWLLELSDDDRKTVGKDIAKAEFGWAVGMPSCRSMGAGYSKFAAA